jgi:beta-galactosidase
VRHSVLPARGLASALITLAYSRLSLSLSLSHTHTHTRTRATVPGGGLYRDIYLVRTSLPIRLADDGVFVPARLTGPVVPLGPHPASGLTADALLSPMISVEVPAGGSGGGGGGGAFSAAIAVYAGEALVAQSAGATAGSGAEGETVTLALAPLPLPAAQLWSVARPFLYTVVATLRSAGGAVVDSVNVTLGVRSVAFDADSGAYLNGQPLKIRAFCNHASFASVGMGVPQRINLLRMQQMRGMGANGWRMSHNPGSPATFALGDALGMTFLNENRVFKNGTAALGATSYVEEMGNMVRRDRQHGSILFYSFCNEAGCLPTAEPALDFKAIAYALDGSRNVTMNYFWGDLKPNPTGSVAVVDVQGLSHPSLADALALHAAHPAKPIGATECCSCLNQRDEDADLTLPPNSTVTYRSNSAPCQIGQTNVSDGRPWMFGQYVWTAVRSSKGVVVGGPWRSGSPQPPPPSPSRLFTLLPPPACSPFLTARLHWRAPRLAARLQWLWAGGPGGLSQGALLLVPRKVAGRHFPG